MASLSGGVEIASLFLPFFLLFFGDYVGSWFPSFSGFGTWV